jgi:aspartate-semialdehyde dehydrogenase
MPIQAREQFAGVDFVLSSTPSSVSREFSPIAAKAGAIVIDNSSAWRMDPEVPLVVVEVNPEALDEHRGIVANPNCVAMVLVLPLRALDLAFGLESAVFSSYQAAGGAGQKGIDELAAQVAILAQDTDQLATDGSTARRKVRHKIHEDTLAFNVVPLLGTLNDEGYTDEEMKLRNESRKILDIPELKVTPTCVRVPVMVGHSIAVRATFAQEPALDEALDALHAFPNLVVEQAPTPLEWAGRDETAVGRVRRDLADPHTLNFFVVGDNLLKGAALNTVEIAQLLVSRGRVAAPAARA